MTRPVLGLIQPSIQWVLGTLTPGVKWQGMKLTTHLRPVPSLGTHGAIPPSLQYIFMAQCSITHEICLHGMVLSYVQELLYLYPTLPYLTLHRLRGCLETVCSEYLDLRGRKLWETEEDCLRSFTTCTLHQISVQWSNQGGWDGEGGHIICMREMRNVYKILVRNPEGKRPCRRSGLR